MGGGLFDLKEGRVPRLRLTGLIPKLDDEVKKVLRKTWTLAWPVVIEQALAMISQVADMAMVGRLGAEAVAAVGLSMQPFFLLNAIFMGISVGTTALSARAVGSGDLEKAGKVTGQSIIVAFLVGLTLSYLGYVNSHRIMIYMGAEPSVRLLGSNYLRAMMPGMLFLFVFTVAAAGMRGVGDTRTPMAVNAIINILHIFTNYVFIFGELGFPRLEVVGAGISSSLSRLGGAVALIYVLSKPNNRLFVNWKKVIGKFDWPLFSRMLRIGLPAAVERILVSTGQIVYTRQVAGLGTEAYAAHSISLNVESLSYMPGIGFATAATAMVGQCLGAGDAGGAQKSTSISLLIATAIMGTMGLMFFSFPVMFLKIFTNDPDIIARGAVLLRIVAFTQIPECVGMVIPGALRGAGDTRITVYITLLGMWMIRLGFTYIFLNFFNMGLIGAWIAMFLDWAVRSLLYWIRFKSGSWKSIKI
ncbi:MATE family efflux transporter [Thermosediminibacter litoriperuensis]|uniref:Probable multidrug resistance protein NorM n=1 Tax=Thermosediminibacter litoriperuensis TaxID=291989 RepID=A0A5S5AUM8_9FIRM|nr:MATE family efflux transporter [Thermosediminibacter litoriperuensis]TYP54909.1 putative MATE family efflux protein [Thermosediminibacter litoriperuensis]